MQKLYAILAEFAPKFERLKLLARELQRVLFPIKDRANFTETFRDHKIMYDRVISAFDTAIADIVGGEGLEMLRRAGNLVSWIFIDVNG
jgi:hypothetical protein